MSNWELRPRIGRAFHSRAGRSILLVCFYDPNGITTVWENIRLWQMFSKFPIEVLNLWPGSAEHLTIPKDVNLRDFSGIILHPTVGYNPQNLFNLDKNLELKFKSYDGIKVLAKQDEHYCTNSFPVFLRDNNFDLLLTCVPPGEIEKVYPKKIVGPIEIMHTLTGYVTPFMRSLPRHAWSSRTTDLSYRGSLQPLSFGRLGFEKRKIGDEALRQQLTHGLSVDISSLWEDRINGKQWYDFLANSKATLGVESGSNLFDFDGEVELWCRHYAAKYKDEDVWSDSYYYRAHDEFLRRYEGNVKYAQISPRHFEAAATGTAQLLFQGDYSGLFKPNRHYFPLKRDFSNWDEALDVIQDEARVRQMTEEAYEDIIHNDALHYETFVRSFDERFTRLLDARRPLGDSPFGSRGAGANITDDASARPRVLVLCAHEPTIDPRIEWVASSFSNRASVCELGTYHWNQTGSAPRLERLTPNWVRVRVERKYHGSPWLGPIADPVWNRPGLRELARLSSYAHAKAADLTHVLGSHQVSDDDLSQFRELCQYFVNTNSALYQAGVNLGIFDCIIAADLESLPAAVALKERYDCKLIFDSHEYWPYSYLTFQSWEIEFWAGLENSLVKHADVCTTVSDSLADHLTNEYGVKFRSIPNAARLSDGNVYPSGMNAHVHAETNFLFQGNFAPGRGLELLVAAWVDAPPSAFLHLRGPDNPFKHEILSQARSLGLLDRTVHFPPAVKESELIAMAMEADVGVIPYDPRHYGNRFACPNKLSQYMAAGRPILTNNIQYVAGIVESNGLGIVANFHDKDSLLDAVRRCVDDREMCRQMGERARRYFESTFNWDVQFTPLVDEVLAGLDPARFTHSDLLFNWVTEDRSMSAAGHVHKASLAATTIATVADTFLPAQNRQVKSVRYKVARMLWRSLPQSLRTSILDQLRRIGRII